MCLGPVDEVMVADTGNGRVSVFFEFLAPPLLADDATGGYDVEDAFAFGARGEGPGEMSDPSAVAHHDGYRITKESTSNGKRPPDDVGDPHWLVGLEVTHLACCERLEASRTVGQCLLRVTQPGKLLTLLVVKSVEAIVVDDDEATTATPLPEEDVAASEADDDDSDEDWSDDSDNTSTDTPPVPEVEPEYKVTLTERVARFRKGRYWISPSEGLEPQGFAPTDLLNMMFAQPDVSRRFLRDRRLPHTVAVADTGNNRVVVWQYW